MGVRDHAATALPPIEKKLILTSELPEGSFQAEPVSIKDRGKTYQYGYLRPKCEYRQVLSSTAKSRVLNPVSESPADRPLSYYAPYTVDCALAVYDTIGKMGRRAPKGDKRSVMKPWRTKKGAYALDKSGRAKLTRAQRIRLLNFIEDCLFDGDPVMIGVDYDNDKTINLDRVTDHWLIVTSREYDEKGTVFFYGMDNAVGKDKAEAEVQFFISPDLHIWKPIPSQKTRSVADYSYLVTNARRIGS